MNSNQNNERGEERDNLLDGLASLPYYERLTRFIRGSIRHLVAGGVTVIDFRPLYTVTVHHLQRQLAEEIQKIEKADVEGQQLEHIRDTLHKYSKSASSPTITLWIDIPPSGGSPRLRIHPRQPVEHSLRKGHCSFSTRRRARVEAASGFNRGARPQGSRLAPQPVPRLGFAWFVQS
jgi:hypothetical protein